MVKYNRKLSSNEKNSRCVEIIGYGFMTFFELGSDAQWHTREDVKNALTFAEYKKAQRTAAAKVEQMCKGVERQQSLSSDFNVESGELAPMFVPGPFAIAHHLISSWVYNEGSELNKPRSSLSSL